MSHQHHAGPPSRRSCPDSIRMYVQIQALFVGRRRRQPVHDSHGARIGVTADPVAEIASTAAPGHAVSGRPRPAPPRPGPRRLGGGGEPVICSSSRASRSHASPGLRRGWMPSTRARCASWCSTRGGWSCRGDRSPGRCSARQRRATIRAGPGSDHPPVAGLAQWPIPPARALKVTTYRPSGGTTVTPGHPLDPTAAAAGRWRNHSPPPQLIIVAAMQSPQTGDRPGHGDRARCRIRPARPTRSLACHR